MTYAFTYHLPLRGLLLPEGGEWRILSTIKLLLNTIDYQIIIFSINFTTKFEEEPIFFIAQGLRNVEVIAVAPASPSSHQFLQCPVVGVLKFRRMIKGPEDVISRFVFFEQGGAVFVAENLP